MKFKKIFKNILVGAGASIIAATTAIAPGVAYAEPEVTQEEVQVTDNAPETSESSEESKGHITIPSSDPDKVKEIQEHEKLVNEVKKAEKNYGVDPERETRG